MYDAEMNAERVATATNCTAERRRIVENKTKEADKPLSSEEEYCNAEEGEGALSLLLSSSLSSKMRWAT
jgi:hypothetical protein